MNVLIITTSASQMGDHPTGLWLEEFAVPYQHLKAAGASMTVASPKGGAVPLDPKTEPDDKDRQRWADALGALRNTAKLEEIDGASFDAVFIPGGHGPLVDLARTPAVDRVVSEIARRHGVVASVCHGPAALLGARGGDGAPIFAGRRATGFTNAEELIAGLSKKVPFSLQDEMKAEGADFHSALLPFTSHVEKDGNLVTGQNPQSSKAVAEAMVELLGARRGL